MHTELLRGVEGLIRGMTLPMRKLRRTASVVAKDCKLQVHDRSGIL
jgi:hypothetical protein